MFYVWSKQISRLRSCSDLKGQKRGSLFMCITFQYLKLTQSSVDMRRTFVECSRHSFTPLKKGGVFFGGGAAVYSYMSDQAKRATALVGSGREG